MRVQSIFKRDLFRDKVAIVTGGATGIGAAISHELSYLGCNVMIASRKLENLEEAKRSMDENAELVGKVAITKCDIRKEDEVENLMQETLKKYGKIDFLVNNAGGQFASMAEHIPIKGWNAVVQTNLTGTFSCCKHAYLAWMRENGGSIVNITADSLKGLPCMAHTGAARAGVDNLTKSLAVEWVENKVRINSVVTGVIDSPSARANYGQFSGLFDECRKSIPASRLGNPEEISAVTCYLLSPAADFITGENVKVDGGGSLYKSFAEVLLPTLKAAAEKKTKA